MHYAMGLTTSIALLLLGCAQPGSRASDKDPSNPEGGAPVCDEPSCADAQAEPPLPSPGDDASVEDAGARACRAQDDAGPAADLSVDTALDARAERIDSPALTLCSWPAARGDTLL